MESTEKSIEILVADRKLNLNYAFASHAGYGHKKIMVEVSYNGNNKEFYATTNNMPDYDAATELEGEEKYKALYEIIENAIEEEITEWIESIEA